MTCTQSRAKEEETWVRGRPCWKGDGGEEAGLVACSPNRKAQRGGGFFPWERLPSGPAVAEGCGPFLLSRDPEDTCLPEGWAEPSPTPEGFPFRCWEKEKWQEGIHCETGILVGAGARYTSWAVWRPLLGPGSPGARPTDARGRREFPRAPGAPAKGSASWSSRGRSRSFPPALPPADPPAHFCSVPARAGANACKCWGGMPASFPRGSSSRRSYDLQLLWSCCGLDGRGAPGWQCRSRLKAAPPGTASQKRPPPRPPGSPAVALPGLRGGRAGFLQRQQGGCPAGRAPERRRGGWADGPRPGGSGCGGGRQGVRLVPHRVPLLLVFGSLPAAVGAGQLRAGARLLPQGAGQGEEQL